VELDFPSCIYVYHHGMLLIFFKLGIKKKEQIFVTDCTEANYRPYSYCNISRVFSLSCVLHLSESLSWMCWKVFVSHCMLFCKLFV